MDIQFHGANCITLSTKQARVVVDDNLADLGGKTVVKDGDVVLFTGVHGLVAKDVILLVDMPGEYEAADVSVQGVAARAHIDESGAKNATMYKIQAGDVRILATGHIHPDLSEKQLEAIGIVDVLIIPVGGNGYTLDPIGALQVIKKVEPKVVIPTHYADGKLSFPVPQQDLDTAIKALGLDTRETTTKFKTKQGDFAENTQLVVLEKV